MQMQHLSQPTDFQLDDVQDDSADTTPLMQRALGEQWHDLPRSLQQHYSQRADGSSHESGWLTISYPRWMQWPLNIMRRFGALLNKSGTQIPTQVNKRMFGQVQHWARAINYPDGSHIMFNSQVTHAGGNILVEHVNSLLAMRLNVRVQDAKLYYESCGYLLKLGEREIEIPEWLALGQGYIEETALAEDRFSMNFWLEHPLFGEIYRYRGEFRIV